MKKTIALLLSVILVVAVLAACSSDDKGGVQVEASVADNAPTAAETAEATEEASTAASGEQGETLARITSDGKLVMLTNAAFPPYEYRTSDGTVAGIDADLAQAIADRLGVELEIVDMEFDSLIPALTTGKGDIVAAGVTITPERQESVDFSKTYADAKQLIIVPVEGATVAGEDDLTGKNIGVQLGTTGDILASDIEDANVSQYKSGIEAAMDLQNGRLDAVILDLLPAQNIASQNDDLTVIDMESTDEEQYAVAIAKNNEDFLEVINAVIAELLDNGTIEELTTKHIEAGTGN